MADRREIVDLTDHFDVALAPGSLFTARALDSQTRRLHTEDWATTAGLDAIEPLGDLVLAASGHGRVSALLELDGVAVLATFAGGRVWIAAAAADQERLAPVLATLRARLPVADPSSAHEVTVTFWTYARHGPQPSWRTISVPGWEEIRGNYTSPTRALLEELMDGFQPAHGGQLVLWHGQAGTGKTFALRALAWEWRSWCEIHYIVDPDSLFGEHADYLMTVLLQPEPMHGVWTPGGPVAVRDDGDAPRKAWRLLVLEDTGELLTPDAKALIGQGLSRFLNVVDGLIGQGLRVLVLVTTNEPIRRLHPAVARPGRCAANVEFHPLDACEAAAWLAARGHAEAPVEAEILASLYSRLEGREAVEAARAAGFGG